ncbi:hypothetical protein Bbelb_177450 [Branchiostoma belcheri]|nr:hypothetical protein Bbelb_177450 [Branchiostoma belcheri]
MFATSPICRPQASPEIPGRGQPSRGWNRFSSRSSFEVADGSERGRLSNDFLMFPDGRFAISPDHRTSVTHTGSFSVRKINPTEISTRTKRVTGSRPDPTETFIIFHRPRFKT